MTVDIGTGATLTATTWATGGLAILSIEVSDISRESVEIAHLGTTTAKAFMPGDLYDAGSIEMELLFDTDNVDSIAKPRLNAQAQTFTITFPKTATMAGGTTGALASGSGFCTAWGWSVPLEDRVTGTVTLKMTGAWTMQDNA
jgi:hypothetical protein